MPSKYLVSIPIVLVVALGSWWDCGCHNTNTLLLLLLLLLKAQMKSAIFGVVCCWYCYLQFT